MAENTITGLIPDIFKALHIVAREMTGMIPASLLDASAQRAAVGQAVTTHATRAASAENIVPASTPPDTGNQTLDPITLSITKARAVPFRWTGEHEKSVSTVSGGIGAARMRVDQIAQAIRTLVNEVEADLCAAAVAAAPRAVGTGGTTPFASTLSDSAQVLKALKDAGAPMSDLQLVIDTAAGANLRTLAQLTKANEAGSDETLRRGVLLDLHGMAVRESAQFAGHTAGTAVGATTNASGYAVGVTTITLASAGTGTIVAGDYVSFDGDPRKYRVVTGDAAVDGGGTITIEEPGLRQAIPTAATAITVEDDYSPSIGFHRNSVILLARTPALPDGGDSRRDSQLVTDPNTGLTFEFAMYPEYRRMRYEVGLAWGVSADVNPDFLVALLG